METIIKSASVKVMQSYNYNHFEASMTLENDNGVTLKEIDEGRKNCQRLTDKAILQYQEAKKQHENQYNLKSERTRFEEQCRRIKEKSEGERTLNEMAQLKVYEDENWAAQFDREYDFEDDDNYHRF